MEEMGKMNLPFFSGKRVFVTGHTGFKGVWLSLILKKAGADVIGYALKPSEQPNLFDIIGLDQYVNSIFGDIRDSNRLKSVFSDAKPDIVIHLAAQPIVRRGYERPAYTYETNVMGTVNILECVRCSDCVKSFLNVTTDKVYLNNEWEWGYRENEVLDGYDPYSNSKSCSDVITNCYRRSFFDEREIGVSTARAGNVIGGGDFAKDRIIPDCVRAALMNEQVMVRNKDSIRPYQHVLEPLFAYLWIVEKQYNSTGLSGNYNVGPSNNDCVTTGELVDLFCRFWGDGLSWSSCVEENPPHEASVLKLDCSRIESMIGWHPKWSISKAVQKTVEWAKCFREGGDITTCMNRQIDEYIGD